MNETNDCPRGLSCQEWYWGGATKDEITNAISGCPNGTFCVRDASTKGDYTLTLKHGDINRLVKIIVSDGKCGFTMQALKFDSVALLIDYYKRNSLVEYNRQLATKLLYPLTKPSNKLTSWVVDGVYSAEHLLCQLRGIHAAHMRVLRFDDQICGELDSLREELKQKKQSRAAFGAAHSLFLKQMQKLENSRHILTGENDLADLDNNLEMQRRRLESIQFQQSQRIEQIEAIEQNIREGEISHNSLRPKFSKLHKELNTCQFRLCQLGVSQYVVDKTLQEVSILAELEQEELSKILLQLSLRWQPDRYLSLESTKESAFEVIRSLMECNPHNSNGIFLIRPSQSQSGHYALTISNDDHIFNCLIEYRDAKHPESSGYAFLNTKLYFATLVDFVRYYSHCSMKDHNAQLDTKLKMPAFKGTL